MSIQKKVEQMKLTFNENDKIIYESFPNDNEKVYIPYDLLKVPLFLQQKSKKVLESRIGHEAYLERKKLKAKNPGLTDKELDEKTSYEAHPSLFSKEYEHLGYRIDGHHNYGLPDHFDGIVWSCFEDMISDSTINSDQTLFYYRFAEVVLINMVLKKTGLKKSGRLQNNIRESIRRLSKTTYFHTKKTDNVNETYQFQLIGEVVEKGELDNNGKISKNWIVGIDPKIIFAMRKNKYIINHTDDRNMLKRYESIALYDYLSYLWYIDHKENLHMFSEMANIKPHRVISYNKICEILGFEIIKHEIVNPSRIKRQLKYPHEGLIKANMIDSMDDILIEINNITRANFNIIYIFSNKFSQRKEDLIFFKKDLLSSEKYNRVQYHIDHLIRKISKFSLEIMALDKKLHKIIQSAINDSLKENKK